MPSDKDKQQELMDLAVDVLEAWDKHSSPLGTDLEKALATFSNAYERSLPFTIRCYPLKNRRNRR